MHNRRRDIWMEEGEGMLFSTPRGPTKGSAYFQGGFRQGGLGALSLCSGGNPRLRSYNAPTAANDASKKQRTRCASGCQKRLPFQSCAARRAQGSRWRRVHMPFRHSPKQNLAFACSRNRNLAKPSNMFRLGLDPVQGPDVFHPEQLRLETGTIEPSSWCERNNISCLWRCSDGAVGGVVGVVFRSRPTR